MISFSFLYSPILSYNFTKNMNAICKKLSLSSIFLILWLVGCNRETPKFPSPDWQTPSTNIKNSLTKEEYYDKILGLLVGSAIGDGMGAPTEMWHHDYIRQQVGYVDSLDVLIREGSAEGPWEDYMPAGSTTDDTRWKYLVGKFLVNQSKSDSLDPKDFAKYLTDSYLDQMKNLKETETFEPEALEKAMMQMNWLQEWAKVAKPYYEGDLEKYIYARDKFYGGEMACAGMLYSPLIGGIYPGNPAKAYLESYRLGLFDIGYARDITGLTGALVAKAMTKNVKYDEITSVCRDIDPLRYFNSRLIGRMAFKTYLDAKMINDEAKKIKQIDEKNPPVKLKNFKRDAVYMAQVEKAYSILDGKLQQIPFHAGEIHLINLAALEFSEGDFQKAMEFVVNFGRDNDTVGAVTGAILGAYYGFNKLPKDLKEKALSVNKNVVKIDLEALAKELTEAKYK
jgi:ADP-ribosylglycohydrolase